MISVWTSRSTASDTTATGTASYAAETSSGINALSSLVGMSCGSGSTKFETILTNVSHEFFAGCIAVKERTNNNPLQRTISCAAMHSCWSAWIAVVQARGIAEACRNLLTFSTLSFAYIQNWLHYDSILTLGVHP